MTKMAETIPVITDKRPKNETLFVYYNEQALLERGKGTNFDITCKTRQGV